jgi:hypothetical protein
VKARTTHPGDFPPLDQRVVVHVAPPETAVNGGIEVHEEKLGKVAVQCLYKMRCECGRSWIALVLPQFVKCPACHKLGLVFTADLLKSADR